MRTKFILCLSGLILGTGISLRAQNVDTSALFIMQRMSNTLKNISSCRVHVEAFYDTPTDAFGLVNDRRKKKFMRIFLTS